MSDSRANEEHRLLVVGHRTVPEEEDSPSYLDRAITGRLVGGEVSEVGIGLENIGNNEFPGGIATDIEFQYRTGVVNMSSDYDDQAMDPAAPGQLTELSLRMSPVIESGVGFLYFSIESADDQDVLLYRNRSDPVEDSVERFRYGLRVSDQGQLRILDELINIRELLEDR